MHSKVDLKFLLYAIVAKTNTLPKHKLNLVLLNHVKLLPH